VRRTRLAAQLLALGIVLWFAAATLRGQWSAVAAAARDLQPEWSYIVAASGIMLAAYALLIQLWRGMLASVGSPVPYGEAARVWLASSLGRYVPGKVWQLGALSVMLQRHGIPALTSTTVALLNVLINTVVGFLVAFAAGAGAARVPTAAVVAIAALAAALVLAPALLPPLATVAARITHHSLAVLHVPARTIWVNAAGSALQWVMYGVAFQLFTRGLLGRAPGPLSAYVATFSLSYLIGFVALFAPGGIVVRELALAQSLVAAGLATVPQAAVLALTSRLWLTVLELGTGFAALGVRPGTGGESGERTADAQPSRGNRMP